MSTVKGDDNFGIGLLSYLHDVQIQKQGEQKC